MRGDCAPMTPTIRPSTTGMGLPPDAAVSSRPERKKASSTATATTLGARTGRLSRRDAARNSATGAISSSLSMRSDLRADLAGDFVGRETGGAGVGERAGDERAEPALVFARRTGFRRRCADERADAAPCLEHALALEVGIDARHGVGVDAQIDGQLADRRQLIARPEPPRGDRGAQRALDLGVNRRLIAGVDVKHDLAS